MIRRFGQAPHRGRRYRPRPGVYAVLLAPEGVLATWQGRELQLPGGGVDPGESPLQALHREVREETGWTLAGPRRIGVHRRFTYMPEYDLWAEKVCTVYLARPARPLGPPSEPDHRAVWIDPGAALGLLATQGDRWALARVLGVGAVRGNKPLGLRAALG